MTRPVEKQPGGRQCQARRIQLTEDRDSHAQGAAPTFCSNCPGCDRMPSDVNWREGAPECPPGQTVCIWYGY